MPSQAPLETGEDCSAELEFDIPAIARALAEDAHARRSLADAFGIDVDLPLQRFVEALLRALDQAPTKDPSLDNRTVFRAAVRALGSNSRAWATFHKQEAELRRLLRDYDPVSVVENQEAIRTQLRDFFPGQTGAADSRAVLKWAVRLSKDSFKDELRNVTDGIHALNGSLAGARLSSNRLMPALAAVFGYGPSRTMRPRLREAGVADPAGIKFPGMGYILATEFFRNLGFDGFKPDRHIQRLIHRWAPQVLDACAPAADELIRTLGTRSADLRRSLLYSLAGQALTPTGTSYSAADNLVWFVGAYMERKGVESDRVYVRRRRGTTKPLDPAS
jgi:hypothetical protein